MIYIFIHTNFHHHYNIKPHYFIHLTAPPLYQNQHTSPNYHSLCLRNFTTNYLKHMNSYIYIYLFYFTINNHFWIQMDSFILSYFIFVRCFKLYCNIFVLVKNSLDEKFFWFWDVFQLFVYYYFILIFIILFQFGIHSYYM